VQTLGKPPLKINGFAAQYAANCESWANAGATMSFFRHEEIYRSDVRSPIDGKPAGTGLPDHRLDESPAGYSSAGWSPPEPASASPADDHSGGDEVL